MSVTENIHFIDLVAQQNQIRTNIDEAIAKVLDHGQYVLGPEVAALEEELKSYTGAYDVITCANGTDALKLCLMTKELGPDDVVFVPSFTFAATAEMIAETRAAPFFVDVDPHTFNMCPRSLQRAVTEAQRQKLTPKGIIAVDLFGLPADYIAIEEVAREANLWVISDAAQSFGSSLRHNRMGSLAELTTTSFFPAKPLGCYGDGGAIFVKHQEDELAIKLRSLRNHGAGNHRYDHVRIGLNSRLDSIQAAILLEKLKIFDDELKRKHEIAKFYSQHLNKECRLQQVDPNTHSALAIYTLKVNRVLRDKLASHLSKYNIPSPVYYHMPLHRQSAYEQFPRCENLTVSEQLCHEVLSLPMHAYLEQQQIEWIVEKVNEFFNN